MFLVKTKLANSHIHGFAPFADELILKGTLVQKYIPGMDYEVTPEEFDGLSEPIWEFISHYCYRHKVSKKYIICGDNARFLNHSDNPNLVSGEGEEDVAIRDIQKGEELTVDYYEYDDEAVKKLN